MLRVVDRPLGRGPSPRRLHARVRATRGRGGSANGRSVRPPLAPRSTGRITGQREVSDMDVWRPLQNRAPPVGWSLPNDSPVCSLVFTPSGTRGSKPIRAVAVSGREDCQASGVRLQHVWPVRTALDRDDVPDESSKRAVWWRAFRRSGANSTDSSETATDTFVCVWPRLSTRSRRIPSCSEHRRASICRCATCSWRPVRIRDRLLRQRDDHAGPAKCARRGTDRRGRTGPYHRLVLSMQARRDQSASGLVPRDQP